MVVISGNPDRTLDSSCIHTPRTQSLGSGRSQQQRNLRSARSFPKCRRSGDADDIAEKPQSDKDRPSPRTKSALGPGEQLAPSYSKSWRPSPSASGPSIHIHSHSTMHAALLALLPVLALATPVDKRWTASPYVGSTTTDLFPPTGSECYPVTPKCPGWIESENACLTEVC
jgi:hypothetical protein